MLKIVLNLHDIEIIETELMLADLETVEKAIQRYTKNSKGGNEALAAKTLLEKLSVHLNNGQSARTFSASAQEKTDILFPLQLLSGKPVMFVANVAEDGL